MKRVLLATQNPGKLREVRAILAELDIEIESLDGYPEVTLPAEGEDYQENAIAKARAAAQATGLPALGDDSGLEVDALQGAPGPLSARYGGSGLDAAGRNEKLLGALYQVPREKRRARFVCWAALVQPDGQVFTKLGECAGWILEAPAGAEGFGYDPVFQPEGYTVSMAELDAAEKNRISHRGRAFLALRDSLLG